MKSHARVVVVGGGVMGVGLLYHLALEGWSDIVAHRKGRTDLGLDLACGRPMPAFQRLAQHDQGACLWHRALSASWRS